MVKACRGRRARRDEIYFKALEYFALNEAGHAYGLMRQKGIRYYSAAFEAVQRLKQEGCIYLIDEERVEAGKPPRKLYRLSIFGFLKFMELVEKARILELQQLSPSETFNVLNREMENDEEMDDLLLKMKKVFGVHSRLCPAFFSRCSELDDYIQFIARIICDYGKVYFDVVPPFLRLAGFEVVPDELPIELIEKAAPFVFCSLIIDNSGYVPNYTRMWLQLGINEKIIPTLKKVRRINLTLRDIELLVFKTIPRGSFLVFKKQDLDELEGETPKELVIFEDVFLSFLERFNGDTKDPNELLKWTVRMKLELAEEEIKRLAKLDEVLR